MEATKNPADSFEREATGRLRHAFALRLLRQGAAFKSMSGSLEAQ